MPHLPNRNNGIQSFAAPSASVYFLKNQQVDYLNIHTIQWVSVSYLQIIFEVISGKICKILPLKAPRKLVFDFQEILLLKFEFGAQTQRPAFPYGSKDSVLSAPPPHDETQSVSGTQPQCILRAQSLAEKHGHQTKSRS